MKRNPSPNKELTPAWVFVCIFLFIMICFAFHVVGAAGFNFFVWGDHIFFAGRGYQPILMWALAGLLFGAATGGLVMLLKYRIQLKWFLVVIMPFVMMLILLQSFSGPLAAIQPRPIVIVADTARNTPKDTTPIVAKHKKPRVRKPMVITDIMAKPIAATSGCDSEIADVTIHTRADSVTIYYRVANYKNGPWSQWKSQFILQQGQFMLKDEGNVRANSLQYYYDIKSMPTQSAENPFTRILCDGPLVIDTY